MRINPVIEKEMKTKMRNWKSPALLTVYLGFLGLVVFFFFLANDQLSMSTYGINYFNPRVALRAYNTLATVQLFLILFITPALTAGAISGERERQTLDLLLCTTLSPLSIVSGKLFVSIMHILLLITASLPVMGVVFLFGGVGVADLLMLFAFYLTTAFMIGSIGIFFSTLFKKSSVSMVVSYITVMALTGGTAVALAAWFIITRGVSGSGDPSTAEVLIFMTPNPIFGFSSLIQSTDGAGMSVIHIFSELNRFINLQGIWRIFANPLVDNILFNVVTTVVLTFVSAWKIKPVKKGLFRRKVKGNA